MENKILKIQQEIGKLAKTETNPFFNSKYLDINGILEALLPVLGTHGLTVVQPLSNVSGRPAIRTIVMDGEKTIVDDCITLPDNENPQKMGAAITYYRRYALQSLFLLQSEDNDAEDAITRKTKKSKDDNEEPF